MHAIAGKTFLYQCKNCAVETGAESYSLVYLIGTG